MPQVSNKIIIFLKKVKLYKLAHAYNFNSQTDTQEAEGEGS